VPEGGPGGSSCAVVVGIVDGMMRGRRGEEEGAMYASEEDAYPPSYICEYQLRV
jgi:hypothetical protein